MAASGEYEIADPDPSALVESLRAFGYTPQTAVADLVDNSITAGARNIWIDFGWNGSNSFIAMGDDGCGMDEATLINAMRPGSKSPVDRRTAEDLGRFGLGLKTASFSQCRHLTVVSKRQGSGVASRGWDLDLVAQTHEWRLRRDVTPLTQGFVTKLASERKGTTVVWERLDRVVGDASVDDSAAHERFLQLARSVREHLAMTFHRFLGGRTKMTLTINGHEVPSWDPFLTGHKGRQVLSTESFAQRGGNVVVKPFVLPHRSKLDADDFVLAGGGRGWNSLQGFYVYRNQRLLVAGDWLGLGFQKEEHFKLARIQVDIGNGMDADWHIDVRKSMARPPGPLRDEFRRIAKVTRGRAVEVYRHRGKVLAARAAQGLVPLWQQRLQHGKVSYEINREHPVVSEAILNPSEKSVRAVLRVAEETIPIPLIAIANAERPEEQATPFDGAARQQVMQIALDLYNAFRARGATHVAARQRVISTEPFHNFPELVEWIDGRSESEQR